MAVPFMSRYPNCPVLAIASDVCDSTGLGCFGKPPQSFDTVNYWGEDYVSCFWCNESAELVRGLDAIEQAALEHELDPAFI